MLIFVAGIHGVGKTFLAKPLALRLGMQYATASQLIREERGRVSWDASKIVDDVASNQAALIAAVGRLRAGGQPLMLDGHFVLRRADNDHERLPAKVFFDLGCVGVVVLTASSAVILSRLSDRGDRSWSVEQIDAFARAEVDHAGEVCDSLAIPLVVLEAPTLERFEAAVADLSMSK